MPSHLPPDLRRRLKSIRLLILDVDGVLTDGSLLYGVDGEMLKRFDTKDGLGIRLLKENGVEVAVLSGRVSPPATSRCRELGLADRFVIQGSRDKNADLDRLEQAAGVSDGQVAAMGDDLPDLPMLARAGFTTCPADAAPEVLAACDHVCRADGGRGAVREVAELILKAQNRWLSGIGDWLAPRGGTEDG
jgi:3-deoxy-D-manno-octulosonate 8-phosphate phosphatase (KDO 8-P phosphatase)